MDDFATWEEEALRFVDGRAKYSWCAVLPMSSAIPNLLECARCGCLRTANASPQDRLSLLAGCVLLTRVKNGGLSGLNGGHKGFYVSMLLRKRLIDFYDGAVFFTPSKCVLKGL